MGTPRGGGDTLSCTQGRGMFKPFSAMVAMQGSLLLAAGEEGSVGSRESQKPLTFFLCCFPSFGVGLSQDSLDPLRSKYRPLYTQHQQDPTLARGWGIPGLVT